MSHLIGWDKELAGGNAKLLCGTHWLMFAHLNPQPDCFITDPPYWTLDRWRAMGTTTRLGGHRDPTQRDGEKWFETISREDLWELVVEMGVRLPKNGHAWVMCDGQTLPYLLMMAAEDETPFTYYKPFPVIKRTADGRGYRQGMGYHGRCCHEYVCLLEKGRHRFNEENWPDVFEIPWTGDAETRNFTPERKPYPTAKPVALFQRLIELSTAPGETVCDPFYGGGAVAVAAIQAGRRFIGSDINPSAMEATAARLKALTHDTGLFAEVTAHEQAAAHEQAPAAVQRAAAAE